MAWVDRKSRVLDSLPLVKAPARALPQVQALELVPTSVLGFLEPLLLQNQLPLHQHRYLTSHLWATTLLCHLW